MNDPTLDAAKRALRAQVRAARRALPLPQRAAEADATAAAATSLIARLDPPAVASYMALPDELDLAALHRHLWSAGRPLLLPRVSGPGELAWYVVAGPDELAPGTYGISEPDPRRARAVHLGDRALTGRLAMAIGIGFTCQLVEDLPHGAHDRVMDGLIIAGTMPLVW